MPNYFMIIFSLRKKFGFVNLTETTGTFKVFVEYTGIPLSEVDFRENRSGRPSLISALMEYRVAGPRALRRNPVGLITKEESIRVATVACGRPVTKARAVLKKTAVELLDWWVTLQIAPEALAPGSPPCVAYYVSATGGFVRERTEPFSLDRAEFEKLEGRLRDLGTKSSGSGAPQLRSAPQPLK